MEEEMMKQYMKNKSLFLQKEELLSRIAELFSKKILRPSGVLVFLLITCLGLFSCSKFLEENPKDIDNATKDAFLYYRDLHMKRQS